MDKCAKQNILNNKILSWQINFRNSLRRLTERYYYVFMTKKMCAYDPNFLTNNVNVLSKANLNCESKDYNFVYTYKGSKRRRWSKYHWLKLNQSYNEFRFRYVKIFAYMYIEILMWIIKQLATGLAASKSINVDNAISIVYTYTLSI